MASTIDAIITRLVDMNVGARDVSIFAGGDVYVPGGPGPFISLSGAPGRAPMPGHNHSTLRRPSIQLSVRGELYTAVETMIEAAYVALGGTNPIANTTIGGVFFLTMYPQQDHFQLPNDSLGRVRLAFNLNITRR
jgi:hypothetical protein